MASTQKSLTNLVHSVTNVSQTVRLRLTFESVETQLWVTKAVRQRIPSRRPATAKRRRPTPSSRQRGTINLRWVATASSYAGIRIHSLRYMLDDRKPFTVCSSVSVSVYWFHAAVTWQN